MKSPLNELALFAGAGGGILGGKLLGWKCVCAVEVEPAARGMLSARQDDGCLEPFPIWDDVRTFDGKPWRGLVDVISGGFPCQDISSAGKGAGLDGARSGLWSEMSRIIGEVLPRHILVENSPVLTSRGLGTVLGDLAALGYDARWGVLGAVHAGAPHKRERIWIVANARGGRCCESGGREIQQPRRAKAVRSSEDLAHAECGGSSGWNVAIADPLAIVTPAIRGGDGEHIASGVWGAEPDVGRVAHGVAARVDRLRAIGNGQVPAVVRLAWDLLKPKK